MQLSQQLAQCEVCSQTLALQYRWNGARVPYMSDERIHCRFFNCPACGHANPFLTLFHAVEYRLKVVPGPLVAAHVEPNRVRLLWRIAPHTRPSRMTPDSGVAQLPNPFQSALHLEQLWPYIVWLVACLVLP